MLAVMQHLSAAIKTHKTHRTDKPQQRDFPLCSWWFCLVLIGIIQSSLNQPLAVVYQTAVKEQNNGQECPGK